MRGPRRPAPRPARPGLVLVGAALVSVGCGAGAQASPSEDAATVVIPEVSSAPEIAEPVREPLVRQATSAAPPPRPESSLPEECEAYLDLLTRCALAVPPGGQQAMLDAAKQTREAWASIPNDATTRPILIHACNTAAEALRQAMPCGP